MIYLTIKNKTNQNIYIKKWKKIKNYLENKKSKKKISKYILEKKNKLEKLKKFPKLIKNKKSGLVNEAFAVVELRKLTLEKSKNINFKPVFLTKKERKKKVKKELDDKRANIRKNREEMRYIRKKFHFQYEDFENEQEFEKLKGNTKNEDIQTKNVAQEMELQLIQKAYLGKKRKKKIVPPSQKFKFNFDWDAKDDTSEAYNDLYKKKAIVSLLSGRGTIAGYDQDEQLNKNKKTWSGLIGERKPITNPKVAPSLHEILRERRKTFKELQKLRKRQKERDNRHWTKKNLKEMTDRDWRIFKEDFRITTKFGGKLSNPIRFWSEAGLLDSIYRSIKDAGYKQPYPIQRMAIPIGLANRDCVGIAETGSGKTAAFVIPMLNYILKQPPMCHEIAGDGPFSLIMAPTRELASQIEKEVKRFSRYLEIKSMVIVGGVDIHMQSALAAHGIECLICTPGRLLDALKKRFLVLNQCKYIVLDEADRMIDMGFAIDLEAIMDRMPTSNLRPLNEDVAKGNHVYRQTFMFTATMPNEIQRIATKYLRNPIYITIGDPNEKASKNVTQYVVWTTDAKKRKELQYLLDSRKIEPPIMIFMNMKKACDTLVHYLREQGFEADSLHGGKNQNLRARVLKEFSHGLIDILVCTDVAGRGIDIKGVKVVVNYDMASSIKTYTHRIGRTGRAEKTGKAYTLITEHDADIFYDLRQMLILGQFEIPRELEQHERSKFKDDSRGLKKSKTVYTV